MWVDAEIYLYGTLKDTGGKDSPNIHIDTKEYGVVKIGSDKKYLKEQEGNLLYKDIGVRSLGKQDVQIGEIDMSSLKLPGIRGYKPYYDGAYHTLMD